MTSLTKYNFLRWRSAPKLKRRTRYIGQPQSLLARFLRLRKPWGKLPRRTVKQRLSVARPWPMWRCRMDWNAEVSGRPLADGRA